MYTLMFNGFQANWRRREEEKHRGKKRKSERERSVVKKDFPTIYLHLRAINNSRVRACRAALSKKLCQHDGRLTFSPPLGVVERPPKRTCDETMRGKWSLFFINFFALSHSIPFFCVSRQDFGFGLLEFWNSQL